MAKRRKRCSLSKEERAGYCRMGARIADRVHVGNSSLCLLRAVRKAFKPAAQRDPALRDARKATYRGALRRHAENLGLYVRVARGVI